MKKHVFIKAYDDLNLAVQSAMLACRKKKTQPDKPITAAISATKLSRPRGRPQGSKDTKPRSKKRSTAGDVCISICPVSAISPFSSTEMTGNPPSLLNTRSFAHAGGELYEGITSADAWSLLQRELEPTLPTTWPTSAIESDVAPEDNVLSLHSAPQQEVSMTLPRPPGVRAWPAIRRAGTSHYHSSPHSIALVMI
jgi:hypothetical protein